MWPIDSNWQPGFIKSCTIYARSREDSQRIIHTLSFFTKALITAKRSCSSFTNAVAKTKRHQCCEMVASKEQALQAFLKSWQAVVFQLQKNSNVGTSDTQKVKVLLRAICNFKFLKYCHFLYDFLAVLRPLSATFQRENLMFTEIKPSVNHAISLLSNLEKNLGEMESLFLSKVSPTGVFGEVQLEKIEARKQNYQNDKKFIFPAGKTSLIERFKTLDDTVAQNISIFDTMGWPEGKKLSNFGDAELELLVQHFKEPLSNMKVPTASFAKEMLLDEWFRLKLLGKDQSFPAFANRLCYDLKDFQCYPN